MSTPVKIVAGAVIGGIGIVTGQPWLVHAGVVMFGSAFTSGVARALLEPASAPTAAEREFGRSVNVLSNEASLGIVYGRTKTGVQIVDVRLHPTDPTILYVVAALALGSEDGSGIEDVEAIYFDERLAISDPTFTPLATATGVQAPFTDLLHYGLGRGDNAQTADPVLNALFADYDADTAGRGVALLALQMIYDPDVYPTGIPNITAVVKGRRVFDPRSDTWAYSDSPALCILDYLTSRRCGAGASYPERGGAPTGPEFEIDEQSFIDAANYHDDVITQGPGTGTRFTCNGRLDTGKTTARNLNDLLGSSRSELVFEGGKYRLTTSQVTTPETFELTPDNIVGGVEYWRGGTADVPNRVVCHYVDDANEWLPNEVAWPEAGQANAFLTADEDFENVLEIALPYTVGHYRAQQIGMVLLREAREDTGIALNAKEEGLKLRVGEVVRVTWPRAGFDQTEFRVKALGLNPDNTVRLVLAEYDADAYSLDAQNTRDTLPASSLPDITVCQPPSDLTFLADATTAVVTQDGLVEPRILLSWVASPDAFLRFYEVQIEETTDGTWRSAAPDPLREDVSVHVSGVAEGVAYDVRIRAVNTIGVTSEWVELTDQTVETLPSIIVSLEADVAQAIIDAASAQGTADGKVVTFFQASPPTAEGVGDLWIDTDDGNLLYRWSGSAWVEVQDDEISQALADAADAQAAADGKIVTFLQATPPTAEGVGDLWIETDDENELHRWSGSAWVSVRDAGIAQAIQDASDAQATADGKVITFFQAAAPTAEGVGDLWIETDNDNKLWRWSGSAWVDAQDDGIAQAIADAATAQATADGKIVTFFQTTTPTAEGVGDLWIDTDDSNHPWRWNGSAWVSARDGSIATAQATADGKNTIFRQISAPTADKVGDIWIDTDDDDRRYQWSGSAWVDISSTSPTDDFTGPNINFDGIVRIRAGAAGVQHTFLISGSDAAYFLGIASFISAPAALVIDAGTSAAAILRAITVGETVGLQAGNGPGSTFTIVNLTASTGIATLLNADLRIGAVGSMARALSVKVDDGVLATSDISANSYFGASGDKFIIATEANASALALFSTHTSFANAVLEIGKVRGTLDDHWLLRGWAGNGSTSAFNSQVFGILGTGRVRLADGSEALPILSFISDPDTGIYRVTTNVLALVAGGVANVIVKVGGVEIWGQAPTSGTALSIVVDYGSGDVIRQVSMGANDSGGSGFRALRVPNS
jgi:hypothetical protein